MAAVGTDGTRADMVNAAFGTGSDAFRRILRCLSFSFSLVCCSTFLRPIVIAQDWVHPGRKHANTQLDRRFMSSRDLWGFRIFEFPVIDVLLGFKEFLGFFSFAGLRGL